MKLWAGRFQKETDTLVNDFNSSIAFDARMYKEDIAGSIAHAAMLGKQGIIEEHEAEKIISRSTRRRRLSTASRPFWPTSRPTRWSSPWRTRTST